jgi:phospholipid-translocating ATPase
VLKVGILFSYVAPLAFVLTLTMLKEGFDDLGRKKRDLVVNRALYEVWGNGGFGPSAAEDLRIGDILRLKAG